MQDWQVAELTAEERLQVLMMSMPDVAWTTDQDGNTIFISPNVTKVYGFTPEEICRSGSRLWLDRIHPDDLPRVKDAYELLFSRNQSYDVQYRIQRRDGGWTWLHDRSVTTYQKGGIVYADGLFTDITEWMGTREALHRERDFISAVLDTAGALVVVLDGSGRIVRFNRACEQVTGYSFDEVRERPLWDLFLLPDEVGAVKTVFERLQAGQFPNQYENHWLTRKGDCRLISWSNTTLLGTDGAAEYVIGIGIDVTERRQAESQRDSTLDELRRAHHALELRVAQRTAELQRANQSLQDEIAERTQVEEALRQSESHMRALMASARDYAVYRVAVDPTNPFLGRVILASPSMKELLSVPDLDDFATWFAAIHPDDLARIVNANRRSLETGAPFDQQFRVLDGDRGDWAWVHVRSIPVADPNGGLTHFNGLVVDITEQKRAEEALRESEAKFRGIVEYANVGIAIVRDARFLFVNPHFAGMLDSTVDELVGAEFTECFAPEEIDRFMDFYTRRLKGEPIPSRSETAMMRKGGARVYADVGVGIIPYEGQQATFVCLRDITEEKRARQALEDAYQTLEQRVEERTRELAALNAISAVVSRSLDLKEILGSALKSTLEVMQLEMGAAYLAARGDDPDGVSLRMVAHAGFADTAARAALSMPLRDSAVERAASMGQPYVWRIDDILREAGPSKVFREEGMQVAVSIPLMAKGQVVGGMQLGTRHARALTSDGLSLLAAIGQQVGMAVENARLYEAEQERWGEAEGRRRVAEGMREILAVLNSRQSLPETLDFIASQTCDLLGSDAAAILHLEGDLLSIQASCGLEVELARQILVPLGTAAAGRALAQRRPVIVPDASAPVEPERIDEIPPEPYWTPLQQLLSAYRAVLSVPLIIQDEAYGAISLYYGALHEFSDEEIRLAVGVSDQVALAIENARLREQARQSAALEERGRLARELHDSVTQSLYSVTMYTEAAARLMTAGQQTDAAECLRDARDTAQEALREMRLMIYQLRPPLLEKGGLAVALQVRLDAVERRGGIHAELIVEGEDRLPPYSQVELHQIAQEALNNALKHARAESVQVRLSFGDDTTCLIVQDNGVGFDLAAAWEGGGMGLHGMQERVQKLGGRLDIESSPGRGTRVSVRVPTGGEK